MPIGRAKRVLSLHVTDDDAAGFTCTECRDELLSSWEKKDLIHADMAMRRLYLGTRDGVVTYTLDESGGLTERGRVLAGQAVRGLATHPSDPSLLFIACGLRGWGLHCSADGGLTSEQIGFADRWVWDVVVDPVEPTTLLVGTEPPGLYRGRRGETDWLFEEFDGIHALPSRPRWMFFHEPFRAGHIHGIARTPARPERIVAGVEHGALILSHDNGCTWQEALVGHDVHRVVVHPAQPDTIYVGAGDGLHVTREGGATWAAVQPLRGKYVHGIVFAPDDPQLMFVYVDSAGCPLYRSRDSGQTWTQVGIGLDAARPADPLRLVPSNREVVFYAADDGADMSRLYRSVDGGTTWTELLDGVPKVWRMHIA